MRCAIAARLKSRRDAARARRGGRRRPRRDRNRQGARRARDRVRVDATTSSRSAAQHGADETINYATEDLRERIKALTGGSGVDVVYDPVGGAVHGAGAALDRVARPSARRRLRRRRDPENSAEPAAAQRLLDRRRVLGRLRACASRRGYAESVAQLTRWYAEGKLRPAHLGDVSARTCRGRARADGRARGRKGKYPGRWLCGGRGRPRRAGDGGSRIGSQSDLTARSNSAAAPLPPPTHIVTTP